MKILVLVAVALLVLTVGTHAQIQSKTPVKATATVVSPSQVVSYQRDATTQEPLIDKSIKELYIVVREGNTITISCIAN